LHVKQSREVATCVSHSRRGCPGCSTDSSAVTWTGVGTGTVRARTSNSTIEWAQWATIYYANNTSSSVLLRETSQWVRLYKHTSPPYTYTLVNEVEGAGFASYSTAVSDYYLPVGGSFNWRKIYNPSNPSAGTLFNKTTSGQAVLWVDPVSFDGTPHATTRVIRNHASFTTSFSSCGAIGFLVLVSGYLC